MNASKSGGTQKLRPIDEGNHQPRLGARSSSIVVGSIGLTVVMVKRGYALSSAAAFSSARVSGP